MSNQHPTTPVRIPDVIDVAKVRASPKVRATMEPPAWWPPSRGAFPKSWPQTQEAFALRFGLSPAVVRDWEQGRRKPSATARALLLVIAHDPAAVDAALAAGLAPPDGEDA